MIFDDYHNLETCQILEDNFFIYLKELCKNDFGYYGPSYLDKIIENNKLPELLEKYQINFGYFIYWLLAMYTSKQVSKNAFDNKLIQAFDIDKDKKRVETIIGTYDFSLYVQSFKDVIKKGLPSKLGYYSNIYYGKALGYCHKYTLQFKSLNAKYVTAFIPMWFFQIKYLHSYVEMPNQVVDVSRNLILPKDEFYSLIKPQVVSIITPEEYQEDYPLLKNHPEIATKDYLIDRPKVLQKIKR